MAGREGGGPLRRQAVDPTKRLWGDNTWGADGAGPARRAARAVWGGVGGHAGAMTAVSLRRRTRDGGAGLDLPRLLLERVELQG